jgi:putative redox protein
MGIVAATHARIGPMAVTIGGVEEIVSEGLRLSAHFARPVGLARVPGLIVLPGFPRGPGGASTVGNTYASLVDRISREAGWGALTFTMRGTGTSEGEFSIEGWLADVRAAIDVMHARTDLTGVWLAGFRLGGTLAIVTAAHDTRVRGLATFAAPATLKTWVNDPAWFLDYARRTGVLRSPDYPPDPTRWIRAIANLDVLSAARRIAPRPWLLVHGSDDDVVPVEDALSLEAAADGCAETRIVPNGPHRLRHDPRAIAALLGWLDRQGP